MPHSILFLFLREAVTTATITQATLTLTQSTANSKDHGSDNPGDEFSQFALWVFTELGIEVSVDANSIYTAVLPPVEDSSSDDAFVFVLQGTEAEQSIQRLTPSHKLFRHAVEALRMRPELPHLAPNDQPQNVPQLTEALFAPYQVAGGKVQLGGCQIEDRPILRVTQLSSDATQPNCQHHYYWDNNKQLSTSEIEELGLRSVEPVELRLTKAQKEQTNSLKQSHHQNRSSDTEQSVSVATVLWCKHVSGKIDLCVEENCVSVPFDTWARPLAKGLQTMPAYECPYTGQQSYHIASTDAGKITVTKAIESCEQSGRKLLKTELQTCCVSNQRISQDLLITCAASGDYLLSEHALSCDLCQQLVAPQNLKKQRCSHCRSLENISKDDPLMARILDTYPRFDAWSSWKLAESSTLYILVGRSLFRKYLAVLNTETLEPIRLASRNRFIGNWEDLPEVEARKILEA